MEPLGKTARGHQEPYAVQFSVFLVNRVGKLEELLDLLDEQEIDVVGLSIVDSSDWAVIRFVSTQANKAREVLRRSPLTFTETQVLLVELTGDHPLTEVCRLLVAAEINILYAYSLAVPHNERPVLVVNVDNQVAARRALQRHGVVLIGYEDIGEQPL